ncbi:MAG: hypothetical protein DCC75_02675 [Proteobacteria bacterium]|nr:MAG: hypothetical protein DCC75_02675 [Pseudomonadota bacterium]
MESTSQTGAEQSPANADSSQAEQPQINISSEKPTEMSAATIARLMGVATQSDLRLLEGKVDMILGRMSALYTRMEKAITALSQIPTGSDLERIDVQIGSLKNLIREVLASAVAASQDVQAISKAARKGGEDSKEEDTAGK